MSRRRLEAQRERLLKERLIEYARSSEARYGRDPETGQTLLEKIVEWLREDYGIVVEPEWEQVKKVAVSQGEVRWRELAAFLLTEGLELDETLWQG